jgi:hypothetical protein
MLIAAKLLLVIIIIFHFEKLLGGGYSMLMHQGISEARAVNSHVFVNK